MTVASIGDYFPQLAGLSISPPGPRPPASLGGQSFAHCCLVALNESLVVAEDGNLSYAATSFVEPGVSIQDLRDAALRNEFPCGVGFSGDRKGAPVVNGMSYSSIDFVYFGRGRGRIVGFSFRFVFSWMGYCTYLSVIWLLYSIFPAWSTTYLHIHINFHLNIPSSFSSPFF